MRATALAKDRGKDDRRRPIDDHKAQHLHVVAPSRRAVLKVYTGSDELKKEIEAAAREDIPNQSASAYLLKLYWREKKRSKVLPAEPGG